MAATTIGQLGRYQLVGVLGTGGMGTVYLGRSPGGRPVAVKAVHGHLAINPDFRSRFRREVALARRVGGPFTAAVIDADPDGDPPWLATEYIQGQSLAAVLAEHGALPEHTVRALAAGLAEALGVIHAAGVIHRDLKPSNVLLSESGPRVIDFGVAKAVEGIDLTGDGPLLGTPGYMAPEHLAGKPLAPSSDVFSLGTVLAHAATGIAPFGAGQSFAVAHRVSTEPPDLSKLPSGLVELILPCLAKDPAQRPSLASIVAQVGAFGSDAHWLPSKVGHSIRTRPVPPARTAPYPASGPFPDAAPAAPAAAPAPDRAAPLPFLAYMADRFSRRPGTALLGPASAVPKQLPRRSHPAARRPVGGPHASQPAAVPRPGANQPGRPPEVHHPGSQHPGSQLPGSQLPGSQLPGSQQAAALRGWAANQRLAHRGGIPWEKLQCPPLATPGGSARWALWLIVLSVVGLFDAFAQWPLIRSLVVPGSLTAPSWLGGAFNLSSLFRSQTRWLPDPVTSWVEHTDSAAVSARVAAVPLLLLCCVALIRRTTADTQVTAALRTTAGWLGTIAAVLLVCRFLHTGFASLLWAVAALHWWTPLAGLLIFLLARRAAGPLR